jgi:hypothetical protein
MDSTKSNQMLRYIKNRDKYNTRAKEYYNNVYYPKHKQELLQKAREQRNKKAKLYIEQPDKINFKVKIETSYDTSLIVSFD